MGLNQKGIENCWEFWECPIEVRDTCYAFTTGSGKDCFNLAENFCPKLDRGFKHCWECFWYKKVNQKLEQ